MKKLLFFIVSLLVGANGAWADVEIPVFNAVSGYYELNSVNYVKKTYNFSSYTFGSSDEAAPSGFTDSDLTRYKTTMNTTTKTASDIPMELTFLYNESAGYLYYCTGRGLQVDGDVRIYVARTNANTIAVLNYKIGDNTKTVAATDFETPIVKTGKGLYFDLTAKSSYYIYTSLDVYNPATTETIEGFAPYPTNYFYYTKNGEGYKHTTYDFTNYMLYGSSTTSATPPGFSGSKVERFTQSWAKGGSKTDIPTGLTYKNTSGSETAYLFYLYGTGMQINKSVSLKVTDADANTVSYLYEKTGTSSDKPTVDEAEEVTGDPVIGTGSFTLGDKEATYKLYTRLEAFQKETITAPTASFSEGSLSLTSEGVSSFGLSVKTRYTIDGSDPTSSSDEIAVGTPVEVDGSPIVIKLATFSELGTSSKITSLIFGIASVSTSTIWDFSALTFDSPSTGILLQNNTIYVGNNISYESGNKRATVSSQIDEPTALGANMFGIRTGVAGQVIMKLSSFNGDISVVKADGTDVATYEKGLSYHSGGVGWGLASFDADANTTYYIYASSKSGDNVGLFNVQFYPLTNTTVAFSDEETVTKNLTVYDHVTYKGITYDNLYIGENAGSSGTSETSLKFGDAYDDSESKAPTANCISFKLPAAVGVLTITPSFGASSNVVLTDGTDVLATWDDAATQSGNAQDYNYESGTETTLYLYSTTYNNSGINRISWTAGASHDYTINAVNSVGGATLQASIASGIAAENAEFTIHGLPKAVLYSGQYYILNDANVSNYARTFNMGTTDATFDVNYTLDNRVVYYCEVENVSGSSPTLNSGCAGGKYAAIPGGGATLAEIPSGTFTVTGCFYDNGNNNRGLYLRTSKSNNDANVLTGMGSSSWSGEHTSSEFTLASATTLYLTGYTSSSGSTVNQSADLDYLIIRRSKVNPTISSENYATYSCEFDLDFSSATDVRGYYASETGTNTIKMTEITSTAAAGEGLFLQKTGESPAIPIVVGGSSLDGNLLKPTTGSNIYDTSDSKIQYVFAKQNSELGFYKVVRSLSPATGKAYLEVTSGIAASRLHFVFDDEKGEVTGIESLTPSLSEGQGVSNGLDRSTSTTFNMLGQRVANAQKGLYIVGGKKVIIK